MLCKSRRAYFKSNSDYLAIATSCFSGPEVLLSAMGLFKHQPIFSLSIPFYLIAFDAMQVTTSTNYMKYV